MNEAPQVLTLERTAATLTAYNPRAEIHGEERVPASDLKFQMTVPNAVLSFFHMALLPALYAQGKQASIDQGFLPVVRFPKLTKLHWDDTLTAMEVVIHQGIDETTDIVLTDCIVDGFKIDCQEGGSINLAFRVQSKPSERQAGRLAMLVQTKCIMSMRQRLSQAAPKKSSAPLFPDAEE